MNIEIWMHSADRFREWGKQILDFTTGCIKNQIKAYKYLITLKQDTGKQEEWVMRIMITELLCCHLMTHDC